MNDRHTKYAWWNNITAIKSNVPPPKLFPNNSYLRSWGCRPKANREKQDESRALRPC